MSGLHRTTPVPNAVFDEFLPGLKGAELKILLVIIRQTLGWEDRENNRRKSQDWISSSQMQQKTGCSERAITSAIESLIQKKLISVLDQYGSLLDSPKRRKGKPKLFFALASTFDKSPAFASLSSSLELRKTGRMGGSVDKSAGNTIVDCEGKTAEEGCNSRNSSATFAEDFRKSCIQLAQKMRITKETLTKEIYTKNY